MFIKEHSAISDSWMAGLSRFLGLSTHELRSRARLLSNMKSDSCEKKRIVDLSGRPKTRFPLTLTVPDGSWRPEQNAVNAAFKKWSEALSEPDKQEALKELHAELLRYARAILCRDFHEYDVAVASKVAKELVLRLDQFHGVSSFSTYAYRAIENNAKQNRRTMGRYRKHVAPEADYDAVVAKASQDKQLERHLDVGSDPVARVLYLQIATRLQSKDTALMEHLLAGREPSEIATLLKINKKTIQTQVRRLRSKIAKILYPVKASASTRQLIR